ncbi:MAG TPA: HPF/RaiA family ribosome-associated protein [Opitutaceae bacterium]|nr:HPF/RaiA family ribosome-associated protein [Opitutaceae bacterium]
MAKGPTLSQNRAARSCPDASSHILIQGIGVEIQPTLYTAAVAKVTKLLRHHRRIIRIRVDFERERARHCSNPASASGRVEISGTDLVARAESSTLSSSLDQLIAKLDRMLRERTKQRVNRRNDRPPGREFRDLIAPAAMPSLSGH